MPELGMRLQQRLVQRQVLMQMQMHILPGDLIDPFRTDEEQVQISQYEVIKNLLATIESGEFIDEDHFDLEINRAIFGKTFEARLGNFGRDISDIVKAYGANEETAGKIISLLGMQKETEERKDIPGQIASGWKNISSSKYFNQEAKDKNILDLIEDISKRDADIVSSMDIIANAAITKNQIDLVNASINKIKEYAERDSRMIPFAQNLLLPIFRAIGKRRESLDYNESKAVYENLVESLYMLDRELSIPGTIEKISDSLSINGIKAITESRLPVPIQISLESMLLEAPYHKKAIELCEDYEFKQGRELKRKIYKGLAVLEELENPKEIFKHVLDNVSDSNGLARILSAISLVHNDPEFRYPYELNTEGSILKNLKLHLVDKSIKRIGLNDQYLERYLEKIESDEKFSGIGNIITTLAGYAHYQNKQISLLKEIIETELDGKFNEWRYSHDLAGSQLAVLNGSIDSWKKNRKNVRIVGEIEALNAHINSVKNVLPKIFELYSEYYCMDFNKDEHLNLEHKIKKNEDDLRNDHSKSESKELGYQTSLLREQLNYVTLLHGLEELDKDNYESTLQLAEKISKKKSKNPLYESAKWIRETLDQPVYRNARKIIIYETDDLETLLRFGEKPVPHCQNWKVNSALNRSLLSFVADANKKLYHISDSNGKLISMSMARLVDWDKTPTILIENVYDVEWSDDYGVALFGSLADKSLSMYGETDKEIRVATNNSRLLDTMKKFSKKYNVEIMKGTIHTKPASSKNPIEYWDCGPGLVNSESEVSLNVDFISFGGE